MDCRRLTYNSWRGMLNRCNNKTAINYKIYGGRGIKVCKEWLAFENFVNDMGLRPGKKYSIERIDNNKGYSLKNCVWATNKQQSNNRMSNRKIEFNGMIKTITEWEKYLKFPRTLIFQRLKLGWSVDKSLNTPLRKMSYIELNGTTKSIAAWAKEMGMCGKTLKKRLNDGYKLRNLYCLIKGSK